MRVLYLSSTGLSDPVRASLPLHLAANGSVDVGHDAGLVLAGDATELLQADAVATAEGLGLPPLRDLLRKLLDHRVPIYV